jgi:hypothetical protein
MEARNQMRDTMFSSVCVSKEFLNEVGNEEICRDIAVKMIRDMPFDRLERLFSFITVNPDVDKIAHDKKDYQRLKKRGLIRYNTTITVDVP